MSDEPGFSVVANDFVSRRRALGGRLRVSPVQLTFRPHIVDRALGGDGITVSLDRVTAVRVLPRDMSIFAVRKRLGVSTADGPERVFLVNKVQRRAEELAELVRSAGGSVESA